MGRGFSNRDVLMNEVRIYEKKKRLAEKEKRLAEKKKRLAEKNALKDEGNKEGPFDGLDNIQYMTLIGGLGLVSWGIALIIFILLT